MAAGSYNIYIEQGATYDQTFTWSVNNTPVNLTGYSARMQIRVSKDANPVVFDVGATGTITLGGALGTIRIQITDTLTAGIAAGDYVYDLELESGSGVTTRLLEGGVTVSREVTR